MTKICKCVVAFILFAYSATAHEMTPTYPKLTPSHLEGIYKTTMSMFNRRADVKYYEIGVFTKEWESIPFVSSYSIIKLDYLSKVTFDVYVRELDVDRAYYMCSVSKIQKKESLNTAISSKICSRFKNE